MHGGTNDGPPPGNTNAVTTGIYFSGLREDEKQIWDRIPIGSLDDELRLLKLQLKRATEALLKQEQNPADTSLLEIERTDRRAESGGEGGGKTSSGVTKRRADYRGIIFRLTGRIAQLENTRRILVTANKDADRPTVNFILEG